jgi:hypothetical protein
MGVDSLPCRRQAVISAMLLCLLQEGVNASLSRRGVLKFASGTAIAVTPLSSSAFTTDPGKPPVQSSAALDNLPRNTVIAYQRTWPTLQLATDFYCFELLDRVKSPQKWDLVGAFVGLGGDSSASRLEREFLSPMTILSLAFPPDEGGDEMQEALYAFRSSMGKLVKVAGVSPGVTEGPSAADKTAALGHWETGRESLNQFLATLNTVTETTRLQTIPEGGSGYPRSKERYVQLQKDAALCRNRGGEQLAGLWGNLMVYGTVPGVNPCGNVNLANYFDM